jgi:hypothetical protein
MTDPITVAFPAVRILRLHRSRRLCTEDRQDRHQHREDQADTAL